MGTMTSQFDPLKALTLELQLPATQIGAVLALLREGNTIPFIARYRKERTGNLDEVQVRAIKERSDYITELEERKQTILSSIDAQGKLDTALKAQILACDNKTRLEDLYLPYKPKRRTRAMIAREKGLEPLAQRILSQEEHCDPLKEAEAFVNTENEIPNGEAALKGARDIVAEIIAENADLRTTVREVFEDEGILHSKVKEKYKDKTSKFEQYYDFSEKVKSIPSHRFLAIRRGEREDFIRMHIEVDPTSLIDQILRSYHCKPESPFGKQLQLAAEDAYTRLIAPSVESDICIELKMRSDRAAVDIFAQNLRTLLLSAPLGGQTVLGIDPGLRTGCKCAIIKDTGAFVETATLFLTQGTREFQKAQNILLALVQKHSPFAIAIGNGTASRETEQFVRQTLKEAQLSHIIVVQVSESGASVYSASEVARDEFPDLDLTVRGAISIARRLQDPLAELVKVEPKALGVGQYQHDVYQPLLESKLEEVVESCVNHVGVDLNTASAPLLSYVAGIGPALAKKIVAHRESKGPFTGRSQLKEVSGLGPRAFEQAAGFCRIRNAHHPLDASAVHPERYSLVEQMAKDHSLALSELVGNKSAVQKIDVSRYISEEAGALTLNDILDELKKPGRDPRAAFEMPRFRDDVNTMDDLKEGMVLEGIVTNVTAFGAFVDIGVHQDGLIHVSELSDSFVRDPSSVVSAGDKLQVRVLEVDLTRKRIALSARSEAPKTPIRKGGKAKAPLPKQGKKFSSNPFSGL